MGRASVQSEVVDRGVVASLSNVDDRDVYEKVGVGVRDVAVRGVSSESADVRVVVPLIPELTLWQRACAVAAPAAPAICRQSEGVAKAWARLIPLLTECGIPVATWHAADRPVVALWSPMYRRLFEFRDDGAFPPGWVSPQLLAEEAVREEAEIKQFEDSLSAADVALFRAGRRLSAADRVRLRSEKDEEYNLRHGMWFAEDGCQDVPTPTDEARALFMDPLRRQTSFKFRLWLMDLWFVLDPLVLDLLIDMFIHGVNLGLDEDLRQLSRQQASVPPMRSVTEMEDGEAVLIAEAEKVCAEGGTHCGPTVDPAFSGKTIALLARSGLVPKQSGKWRWITDFRRVSSQLNGRSPNDCAHKFWSFPFPRDALIESFIANIGPDSFAVGVDKKAAFTSLLKRVQDVPWGTLFVRGFGHLFTHYMQFGFVNSNAIWDRVASAFAIILLVKWNLLFLFSFVDDHNKFLKGGRVAASMIRALLQFVAYRYGYDLVPEKTGMSQREKFLGWIWDLILGLIILPDDKRAKYESRLSVFCAPSSGTLGDLEKLLGCLYHVSYVVSPLHRMIAPIQAWCTQLLNSSISKSVVVSPSSTLQRRFEFIAVILRLMPGRCAPLARFEPSVDVPIVHPSLAPFMLLTGLQEYRLQDSPSNRCFMDVVLMSDWSALAWGMVNVTEGRWYYHVMSPSDVDRCKSTSGAWSSPVAEGLKLLHFLFSEREKIYAKRVLLMCDNLPLVQALCKGFSPIPALLSIVEEFVLAQILLNTIVVPVHISTEGMSLCDELSRGNVANFTQRFSQVRSFAPDPRPCLLEDPPLSWRR